jgi:hypothetical protein
MRRGKRIAFAAAIIGGEVVALLVVGHWATVLDHFEAWTFQLTRQTKMVQPLVTERQSDIWLVQSRLPYLGLANFSGWPVIVDPGSLPDYSHGEGEQVTTESLLESLRNNGWRVIEQRFPRRAYVVIRAEAPEESEAPATKCLIRIGAVTRGRDSALPLE